MKILFICTGNVARSQEAAAYLKLLRPDLEVISAGTEAVVGKPINPDVLTVATEDGLDLGDAYRKQLTRDMMNASDYIVSFVEAAKLPAGTQVDEYWDVPDPRGGTLDVHRHTRDNIKERVTKLAAAIV